ncbi:hypothetical protein SCLCIDRAFT_33497 [Scleroderma citrinum Foug A]|uniref:Uncharacterized protein n=1 Tax=Scleroderma citrinum Foug A TaxID=1036808 RepID=A0A0C3D4N7_9AGAM|nr:hypothetical protein SCLCIDRAFT_33497 [Scleroderma citrinum Foug A]
MQDSPYAPTHFPAARFVVPFSASHPDHLVRDGARPFYDVAANEQKVKFNHRAAVLAGAFGEGTRTSSGGLDNGRRELDLETEKMMYPGNDSNVVSAMSFAREQNYAIDSVEGQICAEYFDLSTEIQDQKYVFSGTDRLSNVDHVWLVNVLAFCIVYNIGSSDGTVSI